MPQIRSGWPTLTLNGAKICFDALNPKNGVSGYKIEVRTLDDGYNPARAASNARQLIGEGVEQPAFRFTL